MELTIQMPLEAALPNVQERKLDQLRKKGLKTVEDLLRYFPRRYEDRSVVLRDFTDLKGHVDQKLAVEGRLKEIFSNYTKDFIKLTIEDAQGHMLDICLFHQGYLIKEFQKGKKYVFFGKLTRSEQYGYSIGSPSYFAESYKASSAPLPVYPKVPGMADEYLAGCIDKAMKFAETAKESDPIPDFLRAKLGLVDQLDFFRMAHTPVSMKEVAKVEQRQTAEMLLPFCMTLIERKYAVKKDSNRTTSKLMARQSLQAFERNIPFELTHDQKYTLEKMTDTIVSGRRLDALVQGDVGCGKTAIAEGMTAVMLDAGYQVAVMAPTVVLAEQHYKEFTERFGYKGKEIVFLGDKLKAKEKRERLEKIKSGKAGIIIGTHAVISKDVEYHNLGLTITDEEHRFGVRQRNALQEKAMEGAHSISMSATPIPRSIALALYGDTTTIYNIRSMPAGRKPVKTIAYSNEERTYEAIYRQIKEGHQAYVICPLIENSDAMEEVDSLEETNLKMTRYFKRYPEVKIGCISGRMKKEDVQAIIEDFAAGNTHILLSTTIVEVGVNVPNATVMLVKNAERFGLAQLHQLRGRVGRGSAQSYCVLLSNDRENKRLRAMVETNDGFEVARIDLEQRGMGNLVGTEQSGFDTAVNAMVLYHDLYEQVNRELEDIMQGKLRYDATVHMADALRS